MYISVMPQIHLIRIALGSWVIDEACCSYLQERLKTLCADIFSFTMGSVHRHNVTVPSPFHLSVGVFASVCSSVLLSFLNAVWVSVYIFKR